MGQEFFIKSADLQDKFRQVFPSQGGAGAGVDISASSQIIPIVDLTESAEGSTLRQDLQSAFSHDVSTEFNVTNTSTTILSSTGYFRIFGNFTVDFTSGAFTGDISLNDGVTSKKIFFVKYRCNWCNLWNFLL